LYHLIEKGVAHFAVYTKAAAASFLLALLLLLLLLLQP
jgi:hypothetical protein